jgi:radical SAM superfamily enzyme YgiQ (UPF0313 family)
MRAMNCWRIRIGIESGNPEILRRIHKGITREDVDRSTWTAYRLGFQVKAFFMIGHVGETIESMEDSIRFARSLPLKDITIQINTPLRGTAQYEECRGKGTWTTSTRTRYSFFDPVYVPEGLTAREMVETHRRFYRRFYLRPVIVWRHARSIRRFSDLAKYARAWPLVVNLLLNRRHDA